MHDENVCLSAYIAVCHAARTMDLDQITPRLYLGSCPRTTADIDRLKTDYLVTAVLNLQTDDDDLRLAIPWQFLELHYRDCRIEIRRCPVADFDQEDLRKRLPACVCSLHELLRAGHVVYVHCTAGMNRSPTGHHGLSALGRRVTLDQAISQVVGQRYCDPSLWAIKSATKDYHRAVDSVASNHSRGLSP